MIGICAAALTGIWAIYPDQIEVSDLWKNQRRIEILYEPENGRPYFFNHDGLRVDLDRDCRMIPIFSGDPDFLGSFVQPK